MVFDAGAGGRDAQQLVPLLAHLQKHIVDPRHSNLFIGILNRVLDTYGPAVSAVAYLPNTSDRRSNRCIITS